MIFGRDSFMNEIIWATTTGRAPRALSETQTTSSGTRRTRSTTLSASRRWIAFRTWPPAGGRGEGRPRKTPTDTCGTPSSARRGKKKGYPTQKPLGIIDRIVRVHSNPGDALLDFFAGSAHTGVSAANAGRSCVLVDNNPEAIEVMVRRLRSPVRACRG